MYQKNRLKNKEQKISLIKEIELLKKVEHQALIKLLDSYETTDTYNIVMEYFSDCSLSDFIKVNRPLKNDHLQKITKQIAEGLFYLHKNGMAHRDIKP